MAFDEQCTICGMTRGSGCVAATTTIRYIAGGMPAIQERAERPPHLSDAALEWARELANPVGAGEALTARPTGAALLAAQEAGLAVRAGRYWVTPNAAREGHRALEDRYLRDTEGGES